jgi:hypothetical protein
MAFLLKQQEADEIMDRGDMNRRVRPGQNPQPQPVVEAGNSAWFET